MPRPGDDTVQALGPAASSEPRGHAPSLQALTTPSPGSSAAPHAAAARQIAQAIAETGATGSATVELALDPPELGRVRLSLVDVGGALTLSISAERPETADLMRRNLALLAEEFLREGLDAPDVDISGQGDGQRPAPEVPHMDMQTEPAPPERPTVPMTPAEAAGPALDGLDLRL
jgi:flagellar hook-length control protein FliK